MGSADRLSIFRKVSSRHHDDETSDTAPTPHDDHNSDGGVPPPVYAPKTSSQVLPDVTDADIANMTAAFDSLNLSNLPVDPDVDTCLAHLRLLFAFQWMKEDVGFTDGLWDLWDSNAGRIEEWMRRPEKGPIGERQATEDGDAERKVLMGDKTMKYLSNIREKRWSLFVARAVDRYQIWWQYLMEFLPGEPLKEYNMDTPGSRQYSEFTCQSGSVLHWREDMLPPLDVLMVWHTHMLNPRAFLEDSILAGMRHFWATGIPWDLVNKAIDNDFNYNVSAECIQRWTQQTGLAWENAKDPMLKTIRCPRCSASIHIPWTTCKLSQRLQSPRWDPKAEDWYTTNAKFVQDHKSLLGPARRPMPGTLLDPKTGTPTGPSPSGEAPAYWFPNLLLKSGCGSIRTNIATIMSFKPRILEPSMEDVRLMIENALKDTASLREIDRITTSWRGQLPMESRMAVRKMMSRYWENFGPFALELSAAVMRQGIFIEKMCQLDWLHSPSSRDTMSRLLTKYQRFMQIMAWNPGKIAVPTLDVDLAWHTHQLSPSRYYRHTVGLTNRFIDHDDKIEDTTLGEQFEWTSRVYQKQYGEVYKVSESFHDSGAASLHPPSSSAHISAHPAVSARSDHSTPSLSQIHRRSSDLKRAEAYQRRLETALARASRRAKRKGREPPSKETVYYDHWGYPYAYAAPYLYPLWWTPGLYGAWYPGYVSLCGVGSYAACAAGTCGGTVAAGACGAPGVSCCKACCATTDICS
ncbi:hypothetical protein C7999DRAFT_39873 [Corynascus novoguineensis]|uniref:Uncharacterized protein n=1 Tax=Corynascus novoguineensis TaxID=1126955 RepID=A0AAN7CW47_9PEZI|nr:hypothetical protein C7999DRAFT_39873 [Corynascus novoguineensis]